MTPKDMPSALAVVHLRVSVEGIQFEKKFEADPELKYTYAWDRRNAYKQKVYGIVPVRGKQEIISSPNICLIRQFSFCLKQVCHQVFTSRGEG